MSDCFDWSSDLKEEELSLRRLDIAGACHLEFHVFLKKADKALKKQVGGLHTVYELLATFSNFADRIPLHFRDLTA